MNIDELITNVKKKIKKNINIKNILIEDKTFLHKNHPGHENNKFHLKITIKSEELKKFNRVESNKKIYKILDEELRNHVHSLQILIN